MALKLENYGLISDGQPQPWWAITDQSTAVLPWFGSAACLPHRSVTLACL